MSSVKFTIQDQRAPMQIQLKFPDSNSHLLLNNPPLKMNFSCDESWQQLTYFQVSTWTTNKKFGLQSWSWGTRQRRWRILQLLHRNSIVLSLKLHNSPAITLLHKHLLWYFEFKTWNTCHWVYLPKLGPFLYKVQEWLSNKYTIDVDLKAC